MSTAELGAATDDELRRMEKRLARAREENKILEQMIEEKTRSLFLAKEELRESAAFMENVLNSMISAVIVTDSSMLITSIGGATSALTGFDESELIGCRLSAIISYDELTEGQEDWALVDEAPSEGQLIASDQSSISVLISRSELTNQDGQAIGQVYSATDISQRKTLEVQLRHAQRLESIGQLAAGVAHEINTPIQYVGDSVRFLVDVFQDLMALHDGYQPLKALAMAAGDNAALLDGLSEQEEEVDLDFVREETPKALTRTLDGIDRVASIVKAMKQFSHPGTDDMAPVDVNEVIETTLTVSKSEYRYVAEMDLRLGDVPEVTCNRGDIGQVLINLVVNAAHAIAGQVEADGGQGRMTIATKNHDDGVLIEISDTGGGIPHEIRDRVFEPFFTTKEPGKGTGQGLSLAYNIIVAKHSGRLAFTVEDGVGTTFEIWLPTARRE